MKRYIVSYSCFYQNDFISNSRNAKKHCEALGAEYVKIYDLKTKKLVSSAKKWGDDSITNITFNDNEIYQNKEVIK